MMNLERYFLHSHVHFNMVTAIFMVVAKLMLYSKWYFIWSILDTFSLVPLTLSILNIWNIFKIPWQQGKKCEYAFIFVNYGHTKSCSVLTVCRCFYFTSYLLYQWEYLARVHFEITAFARFLDFEYVPSF